MEDEIKPPRKYSHIFGLSVRGCVLIMMNLTLCICAFMRIEISEPFKSIVGMVDAFYFAQKVTPKQKEETV